MHLYVLFEFGAVLLFVYLFARGFKAPNALFASVLVVLFLVFVAAVWLERVETGQPTPALALVRLIESGFPVVAAFVILSAASYWKGLGNAEQKEWFLVSRPDQSVVVLRQYGERLVAGRLTGDGGNVVDPSVRIYLRSGDAGAREFERKKLVRCASNTPARRRSRRGRPFTSAATGECGPVSTRSTTRSRRIGPCPSSHVSDLDGRRDVRDAAVVGRLDVERTSFDSGARISTPASPRIRGRLRRLARLALAEDPALDCSLPCPHWRLPSRSEAQHDVEHSNQSYERVEAVFSILKGTETRANRM